MLCVGKLRRMTESYAVDSIKYVRARVRPVLTTESRRYEYVSRGGASGIPVNEIQAWRPKIRTLYDSSLVESRIMGGYGDM